MLRIAITLVVACGLASVAGGASAAYRVRPGDTLTGIATRFDTSVTRLERLNDLSSKQPLLAGVQLDLPGQASPELRHRVVIGDTLSGLAERFGTTVAAIASASGIDATRPLPIGALLRIPPRDRPVRPAEPPAATSAYSVRPGDTLGGIAARFGTTVSRLAGMNALSAAAPLPVGRRLQVPRLHVPRLQPDRPPPREMRYRVVQGDTLSALALRFGTSIARIAAASGVDAVRPLLVGVVLRIPVGPHTRPAPPLARYTVRSGDTLSGIALHFGVSIGALADLNGLDPDSIILVGTRLVLPAATIAQAPDEYAQSGVQGSIERWAAHYGVDPRLVAALAWMESGYNNSLISPAGAVGVMQITPDTWSYVQQVLLLGQPVAHTTDGNVRIGVAYLHHLLHLYGGNSQQALAAYYQGARALDLYGLLPGTSQYVTDILALEQRF